MGCAVSIRPAPVTCTHPASEPVDVRDHTTGGTITVARICTSCLDQLPAAWGCDDCEWTEIRRVCDEVPSRVLATPCPRHQGG